MYDVQTLWVSVLTQGWCGFPSLYQGCECFGDLMEGLIEALEALDRLSEVELAYEFKDENAGNFLRARIRNGDKLPGSQTTFSTQFAHVCKSMKRHPFIIWTEIAETMKLRKAERSRLASLVDRVTDEYVKKVEAFKRITKITAVLTHEPDVEYNWYKPVDGEVLLKAETPYEKLYSKMKEWGALPDDLPEDRFVYYIGRGHFEDLMRWSRGKGHVMDIRYLAHQVWLKYSGDERKGIIFRAKACSQMETEDRYFTRTNGGKRILEGTTFD